MRDAPVTPLAHAGHWIVQIAYFAPVLCFLVWLGVAQWRERRSGRSRDGAA